LLITVGQKDFMILFERLNQIISYALNAVNYKPKSKKVLPLKGWAEPLKLSQASIASGRIGGKLSPRTGFSL
jgi:hypothetical protein